MVNEMEFKTIIGKEVLLEKLRENRDRYAETRQALVEVYERKEREFVVARAEYSENVVRGLLTEDAKSPYPPSIPEDRTETYEMYITMVAGHVGDTVEIDNESFRSLYWDKWGFIKEHVRAMADWSSGHPTLVAALTAYEG